ncbi:hypothetical protein FDP41_011702 [Naegleria fowleri]|uniref:Uncharacterized protein n=1 Tax=Naegleria fowleri TaxID=5763 RepID=A0A6A5C437_NAEFO|nr:uncharacterized protein FDP41_011702 [Naegleria fowleri]KAF0981841.1 hypothetical protein FDP41_011702 [Naegleria fowleri]
MNGTSDSFLDEWMWPMIQSLYFNSFMSGLFAGIVAILVTVIIEKLGPQIGGVIGTLPTTIVPAAIGFIIEANKRNLKWEEKKHVLIQQFFVIPLALFCNCLFLLVWKVFPDMFEKIKSRLWKRHNISQNDSMIEEKKENPSREDDSSAIMNESSVRDETSLESTSVDKESPYSSLSTMKGVEEELSRESTKENLLSPSMDPSHENSHHDSVVENSMPETTNATSGMQSRRYIILKMCLVIFLSLFVWFVLASIFVIITRTVALSDEVLIGLGCAFYILLLIVSTPFILSGLKFSIISGLLTAFPAIFLTAMVTLWLTQGEQASVRAAPAMMLGSSSIPLFAISVCVASLYMNMFVAIVVAYLSSVIFGSIPAYAFLWWRKRVAAAKLQHDSLMHQV